MFSEVAADEEEGGAIADFLLRAAEVGDGLAFVVVGDVNDAVWLN